MPRIPIFSFGHPEQEAAPPRLTGYTPSLSLEGLQLGVDNLRHDVHLSPKFVAQTRSQISRLIVRHGDVEALLAAEAPQPRPSGRPERQNVRSPCWDRGSRSVSARRWK